MRFIKFVLLFICFLNVFSCNAFQKKQNKIATKLNCDLKFDGWNNFESEAFSFQKPSYLSLKSFTTMDSNVWEFNDDDIELIVDSGNYSGFTDIFKDQTDYTEKKVLIDDVEATFTSFELKEDFREGFKHKFLTALYFPRSPKTQNHQVAFWINYKRSEQKATACAILSTIKFNN